MEWIWISKVIPLLYPKVPDKVSLKNEAPY